MARGPRIVAPLVAVPTAAMAAFAVRVLGSELPPRALAAGQAPVAADAALVLGGDPGYERTRAAVALWKRGLVPLVVFSGSGGPGDGSASLAAYARGEGLPPHAIRMEGAATSTVENLRFSRPILEAQRARRVLLVTSGLHLLRASLTARRQVSSIAFVPVGARALPPAPWWRAPRPVVREYGKIVYYLLRRYL